MVYEDRIERFLAGAPHAVVGASTNRDKYGNKVLRAYVQNQREVYPVNPNAASVQGLTAYPDLMALPVVPHGISIITPPAVTEGIVVQAIELAIEHIWMQPGAESIEAVRRAEAAGLSVIHSGPCLLVVLGYRESA